MDVQDFLNHYDSCKDPNDFIQVKKSTFTNGIQYYSLFIMVDGKYIPLKLKLKDVKCSGLQSKDNYTPTVNIRKDIVDGKGRDVGKALDIIETGYFEKVKKMINNCELPDNNIHPFSVKYFVQENEKIDLEHPVYRIKCRTQFNSNRFKAVIDQVTNDNKQMNMDFNVESLKRALTSHSRIWALVDFSYMTLSKSGYNNCACFQELYFKQKAVEPCGFDSLLEK